MRTLGVRNTRATDYKAYHFISKFLPIIYHKWAHLYLFILNRCISSFILLGLIEEEVMVANLLFFIINGRKST